MGNQNTFRDIDENYDGPSVKEQIKTFLFSGPFFGGRLLKNFIFTVFGGEKIKKTFLFSQPFFLFSRPPLGEKIKTLFSLFWERK